MFRRRRQDETERGDLALDCLRAGPETRAAMIKRAEEVTAAAEQFREALLNLRDASPASMAWSLNPYLTSVGPIKEAMAALEGALRKLNATQSH